MNQLISIIEYDWLDWEVYKLPEEQIEENLEESFHTRREYLEAVDRVALLWGYAVDRVEQLDQYEVFITHGGIIDEDQIYEEWCNEKPLYFMKYQK